VLVYPQEKKPGKAEKKAARSAKKELKAKMKPKEKKPGGLKTFLAMLEGFKVMLSRFRRKLLIKELTIHYIAGSEDPAKAAMAFGSAYAVFGAILPVLENNFRIRKRDLRASADFESKQPEIYAVASFSLAIWEAFFIVFAMVPTLVKMLVRQLLVNPG